MQDNFCVECNKEFRSQAGLNGHNQWKHNKLPEKPVPYTVTGRTVEMFERVQKQLDVIRDEQENLKDMMQTFQINQQGNSEGNNSGSSGQWRGKPMSDEPIGIAVPAGNKPEPEPEPTYYCNDCKNGIDYGQSRCGNCNSQLNWSGIDR